MVEIGCWRISVRPAFLPNVIPKISRDRIDDVIGGSTNTKAQAHDFVLFPSSHLIMLLVVSQLSVCLSLRLLLLLFLISDFFHHG